MNEFICKFCNDIRKNANSLRNHERLCKENPERQSTPFMDGKQNGHVGRNQFIKAKENGIIIEVSEETRQKLSEKYKDRDPEISKNIGIKSSKTIQEKVKNGDWHISLAKNMHYEYKGYDLHGKWELEFAKYLDSNNIEWDRPKTRFKYIFEDKERYYTPDFYLIESDEYVEIKGFKTEKDVAKWNQFNYKTSLIILMEKDLKELKII